MTSIKSPFALAGAACLWVCVVLLGNAMLWRYKNTPEPEPEPIAPAQWPAESQIKRAAAGQTLVLFVHPRCACTQATLGELARLMAHVPGRCIAHVVFFRPQGSAKSWAAGPLWDTAVAIPGVRIKEDEGGREAQLFHAATSGHAILYDRKGRLNFDGGITSACGHAGDSAGLATLISLLQGGSAEQLHTSVFGCSIKGQSLLATCGGKPCSH